MLINFDKLKFSSMQLKAILIFSFLFSLIATDYSEVIFTYYILSQREKFLIAIKKRSKIT